jgi:O-antigen/teichoic acid export membrane protein
MVLQGGPGEATARVSDEARAGILPHGIETFGVKVLAYAAGAIVSVLAARTLGPNERGAWSLSLLLASILALVANGGLSSSALFLIRSRPDRTRAAVFMSMALVFGVSVVLGSLMLSPSGLRLISLLDMPGPVAAIVSITVPVLALLTLVRQLMTGIGDLSGANASVLAQALVMPVALVIMLATGPPVAAWALWGYLAVTGGTLWFSWFRLLKRVPPGPRWDGGLLGTLVSLGLTAQLAGLALTLTFRSDLFLVSHWLGLSAAGVYSIGLTLSEMLRGIPESAQALVVSRATRQDLTSYAAQVARITLLLTAVCSVSVALAGPVIVPFVFGRAYGEAALVLSCLVPGVLGLALSYAISPLLFLEGRNLVSAVGAVSALGVLWAFSLFWPSAISLTKVAVAASLAYWTLAGIQLVDLVKRGRIDPRMLIPAPGEVQRMLVELWRRAQTR